MLLIKPNGILHNQLFAIVLMGVCSVSHTILLAQNNPKNTIVVDASYAYLAKPRNFGATTIGDQRYGYLQAMYLFPLASRIELGPHLGWIEKSYESNSNPNGQEKNTLLREQDFLIGLAWRLNTASIDKKLNVFFQANSDVVLANKREFGMQQVPGTGAILQFRPGIQYRFGKLFSLEAGLGLMQARYIVWGGSSGGLSEFDFNSAIQLQSFFLGATIPL